MKIPEKTISCYVYPLTILGHSLLRIGWIFYEGRSPSPFYYDNTPIVTINYECRVKYLAFGLTDESVMARLRKKAEKMAKEVEKDD